MDIHVATHVAFPLALERVRGPVFTLDATALEQGLKAACESPRHRIILPVNRSAKEGVQRMLNFMKRGSYARPHCHPEPENIECIAVIHGAIGALVFDPNGAVMEARRLEAGNPASCLFDIEPGIWHTFVPLTDDAVILEIKRGPYNSATDKSFAQWAPEEGAVDAAAYLGTLEALFPR